jgi:hypothetical protein
VVSGNKGNNYPLCLVGDYAGGLGENKIARELVVFSAVFGLADIVEEGGQAQPLSFDSAKLVQGAELVEELKGKLTDDKGVCDVRIDRLGKFEAVCRVHGRSEHCSFSY